MTNRQTTAQARGSDGSELAVRSTSSDSPLLPIEGIERLHEIRPDRVDWMFEQTEAEASARRAEQRRVNTFEFIERILGMLLALCIGLAGIGGGLYGALNGHDWFGVALATVTIGTLAIRFIKGGGVEPESPRTNQKSKPPRS